MTYATLSCDLGASSGQCGENGHATFFNVAADGFGEWSPVAVMTCDYGVAA